MATPVRYPSGISVNPTRHVVSTFPAVAGQSQTSKMSDFQPYISTEWDTATGKVGTGTVAAYAWNSGAVKVTSTATATDVTPMFLNAAQSYQFIPGNQFWFDTRFAVPTASNDANIYIGLSNSNTFSSATDGVWLIKPAGGSTWNLVIRKASSSTIFSGVADTSKPNGLNNTSSVAGTLAFNTTGTTFTNVTVASSGSGYQAAPLVLATGTAGSGGQLYAQLGSGGLYAPYITAAGSGYTANTLGAEIDPWINFQLFYDGKGTLYFGVNGKAVLSVGPTGQTAVAAGSTTAFTGAQTSFVSTASLTVGVAPVQPKVGDVYTLLPQIPLLAGYTLNSTTTNVRTMYIDEFNIATEQN
jgi:hypothetical protein